MVRARRYGAKTQTRRVVDMNRLKVIPRKDVYSDLRLVGQKHHASKGKALPAMLNDHGAVSCLTREGWLGLKPEEFDFVCPWADGATHLVNVGGGKHCWTVQNRSLRLWVRERWGVDTSFDELPPRMIPRGIPVYYHATAQCTDYKWRPGMFMPRWASRDSLFPTEVRLVRLQEISEEDAIAEGIEPNWCGPPEGWNPEQHGWKNYLGDENGTECMWSIESFRSLWQSINAKTYPWASNPWVWAINFKEARP